MTEVVAMTAKEFRARLAQQNPEQLRKIALFNERLESALRSTAPKEPIYLSFDDFGYDWDDIQFVIDADFKVQRNSACLWWEVTLP